MLKKLIKHEFKALGRYFLPMFALILVLTPFFSLFMRLGFHGEGNSITGIMAVFSIASFTLMLFAMFTAVYIFVIIRFYRTTATSEAYLTFTLPASVSQILWSKLIVSALYQLLTFVVAFLSIFGTLIIAGALSISQISDLFTQIGYAFDSFPELADILQITLILSLISLIIGLFASSLQFYCSIMLGQLFNNHRILISIGMYIGIYIVMQMVNLIVTLPVTMSTMLNSSSINMNDGNTVIEHEFSAGANMDVFYETMKNMNSSIVIAIIMSLLFSIVFYIVTVMIMKKKLNVR